MAVAVDEKEIISSMKTFLKMGIYACPEAASTLAALKNLETESALGADEKMLLYLTGNAMKYFEVMEVKRDEILVLNRDADLLA